jgi:hypothetical protein
MNGILHLIHGIISLNSLFPSSSSLHPHPHHEGQSGLSDCDFELGHMVCNVQCGPHDLFG